MNFLKLLVKARKSISILLDIVELYVKQYIRDYYFQYFVWILKININLIWDIEILRITSCYLLSYLNIKNDINDIF